MKRILINQELCSGCRNCQLACMAEHTAGKSVLTLDLQDRSNQARNFIELGPKGKAVPVFCRHCDDPACVTACMSGAMSKDRETGVVTSDPEKCAGCWMCVMSCPFSMVRPDYLAGKVAVKCDFCNGRAIPRCIEACPTGAISLIEITPSGIEKIPWPDEAGEEAPVKEGSC